jgi:nucleoside-diphosphate-sugar epimerase
VEPGVWPHIQILNTGARPRKVWRPVADSSNPAACAPRYAEHMQILITGATGKVGSRLARRLAQRGHHIRALVRDQARAAAGLSRERIELVTGDLLDTDSLSSAVRGVDAVVHCAAFFRGARPEQAHAVNDLGTRHLALAARAASVGRFVFTSTGLVYGSTGGRPAGEDDAGTPTEAYPLSKLAAEHFLLALTGLDVRVLRLPFVYGDGDPHIEEVLPVMRGFLPTQRLSLGHHVDIARAVALVLETPSPAHRVYNVADDEAPDLATLFASVGAPPPDGSNADWGRAFDAILDGRRIRADLGFAPTFPRLADAIAAGALSVSEA